MKRGPRFLVRRRDVEAAAWNPNRPRGQARYGPWVTVSTHDSLADAREARARVRGLFDVAVFLSGKRLPDTP